MPRFPREARQAALKLAPRARGRSAIQALRLGLLAVAVGALLTFAPGWLAELAAPGNDGPITNPTDFRAFYCAGAAIDAGRDPYRTQPMWGCQSDVLRANGLIIDERHVMPAPLPPYALALFASIARLPFAVASMVWALLGITAVVLTIGAAQRLSGLSLPVTALSLIAAEGWASLVNGQIVPFVVFALAASALALRARRPRLAAGFATFALIEPHIAVPVVAALAFAAPATRRPLALGLGLLGALSLAAVGPAVCFEYATQVLPLHARSEVTNFGAQYSLSSLLWALGVNAEVAVKAAELAYLVSVVAGVALGRRLAERCDDAAFVVTTPLTLALLGGPFLHIHQIAAAIPFALMLLGRCKWRGAKRALLVAALVALAIPWQTIAELPGIADALGTSAGAPASSRLRRPEPEAIAEIPETRYLEAAGGQRGRRTIVQSLIKVPTWFGLATLVCGALAIVTRRRAEPAKLRRSA